MVKMVSLINFKIVSEELSSPGQLAAMSNQQQLSKRQRQTSGCSPPSSHMFVRSIQQQDQQPTTAPAHQINQAPLTTNQISANLDYQQQQQQEQSMTESPFEQSYKRNFVVTWRNLQFAIKPKWHQKIASAGLAGSRAETRTNGNQQSSPASKIVLDKLDGSFKSGELTAILGPSGAGKTTLLDCLTGRRKYGLSGSIRISSSPSSSTPSSQIINNKCHFNHLQVDRHSNNSCPGGKCDHSASPSLPLPIPPSISKQKHLKPSVSVPTNGDNLKVSIIPQNDHLMGHLTVYETLNYASKMKNFFQKQFNHQLNIKRVAQQLSLMDCLGTRVNKLSGGQYKRVSIAQELLSSPDILILDEPTSGLDAMTCYQTVQVLRKLTDERQSSGQNQIAVILTIHQPNSDVFQQFNHVYVVAQGGKCIYEGPPANIESVINRVGIRLPSSHYNPATMIVEIAAGKFGLEAISKLNSIQKKQYEFVVEGPVDEQNSTGDSAVDCPSSSSSNEDEDDDDDEHTDSNNKQKPLKQDSNNNATDGASFINKGFVMENEETNDNNNNTVRDVIVVVPATTGVCDADSVEKIKMMNNVNNGAGELLDSEGRRKKRRRTRKRSGDQGAANNIIEHNSNSSGNEVDSGGNSKSGRASMICAGFVPGCSGDGDGDGGGNGNGNGNGNGKAGLQQREKRLKLNSLKADQKFPFWRHTYLHFHRSWLSIVRDPMLCSMQLALHILVPLMVSLVYGSNVGKPNACPRAGPMDIMAYALEPTDSALQLQEDLRTTLENIGYIFFKLYGIIFAAMTVTVLTFPLDMHVLVKEFRNGWYGMSSYFLGRTLADIPFQLTLPLLAMSLSYYATGQPYSYLQWRFLSITGILILSSLIAQSQGLLFGAILMDKMKAAVFVAPAATTPIILFAGFLVRTQSIPRYLRPLSNFSYLRYAIEACLISRYGFNQCECDPAVFNQTVPELPPIARSMLDYWLSSFKASSLSGASELHDSSSLGSNATALGEATLSEPATSIETTTLASSNVGEKPDLFTKLIDSLAKANSFGRNITSCEQVVPYPMIDYDLKDSQLLHCFGILLFMLVFTRLLTFFIVCFKVKRRV